MSGALRREVAELDATSLTLTVGAVRLHVLDYGGRSPNAAVVVPGAASPAITWDFAAVQLRGLVRPYVLDLRGCGLSDAPATGYALEDHVRDLRGVLAQLGLVRPLLVGHSLGARIAAAAAADDPELAGGLVLIEPPLSGPGAGPYPVPLESLLDPLRLHPRWSREQLDLWARWLETCTPAAIIESHRGFEADGFLPLWHRLRPPLALIHGTDSAVVTAAAAEELAEGNDAAVVIRVPDAGHMLPWDNPRDFVAVLQRLAQMLTASEPPAASIPIERTT
jgi:N-formylmaleamate deformylase